MFTVLVGPLKIFLIVFTCNMFCLSFIVAFKKEEQENSKTKSKGAKKEKGKKEVKPEEPLDPKFIDCSKCFKSTCHIDYSLYKGFSYSIDVACWGHAAKVYLCNLINQNQ